MNYECSYNSDLDIIESVTHGLASKTELVDMLHSIAELCVKNESADIIVDHSQLDAGSLTMDDIAYISRQVAAVKDILKTRKCAHVVTKDIQFGLVRAWEIMIEIEGVTDFQTRVFKNKIDAVEWIKTGL